MSATYLLGAILWNAPQRWPLVVGAVLLAIAVAAWLYPRQVAGLPRGLRWVLPGLRVGAMAALAVALMRPVLVRPATVAERGAVVVLVDASESAAVVDTTRTSAALLTIAQALGWVPAGATEAAPPPPPLDLRRVYAAVDEVMRTREEISYAELTGRDTEAARLRLEEAAEWYSSAVRAEFRRLPTSRPASLADALANLGNVPGGVGSDEWERQVRDRLRRVNETHAALRVSAEERLLQTNPQVRELCDKLARQSRLALAETVLCEPGTGLIDRVPKAVPVFGFAVGEGLKPLPLRGDGEASVRRLLVEPTARATDLSGALAAVRRQMGGQRVQAIVLLSDGRQVGGTEGLVTTVQGAVPVFAVPLAGRTPSPDLVVTRVTVPGAAWVGDKVSVRADVRAVGVRGPVNVRLKSGGAEFVNAIKFDADQTVGTTFAVPVNAAGTQDVHVSVEAPANEVSRANNHVTRTIKVLAEKVRVLAVAGGPTWDFQYLRNSLGRASGVALAAEVLGPGRTVAMSAAEIEKQDVIVLNDVAPGAMADDQWQAVRRAVEDRGAAAFLVAGEAHLPGSYQSGPVAAWLPFEDGATWRTWSGEEPGYYVVPASGARALEPLQLDSPARWPALPGVFRFVGGDRLKPGVRPLLVDRDSQVPVLTEGRAGRGRAYFVGVNETWRWRWKVGERDQDRLWVQLIRHAAGEPYAVIDGPRGLDVRRPRVNDGEAVRVRVRTQDEKPVARVMRDGKEVATIALASEGVPGRFEGAVQGLGPGAYEVKYGDLSMALVIQPRGEAERADLSGDERYLTRIANTTGGDVVPLDQIATLPQRVLRAGEASVRVVETSLWDGPYLYALVIAALTAEWAMRKQFGLA